MRTARPLAALLLSALIAVTGLGLAAARGQAMSGGQVVLCSGAGGAVTVTLGPDGLPTGPAHVCPDMALGLILAVAMPDVLPARDAPRASAAAPATPVLAAGTTTPVAAARGPPTLI